MYLAAQLVLLTVICCWSAIRGQTCTKTFSAGTSVPDEELMNALYIADPNPATGYLSFGIDPRYPRQNKMIGTFKNSNLTYNSWLLGEHDGVTEMANLWVYVSLLVSSDIDDLNGHYLSLSTRGTVTPKPAIHFKNLETKFQQVCSGFNSYTTVWPFSCFDSSFFCSFKQALEKLSAVVQYPNPSSSSHQCQLTTQRVNEMSDLAVDNDARHNAMDKLYQAAIVDRFSTDTVKRPFEHSGLVRLGTNYLTNSATTANWRSRAHTRITAVQSRMSSACSGGANAKLKAGYYCKANEFIQKWDQCRTDTHTTKCGFKTYFQKYFETGRFIKASDFEVLNGVISELYVQGSAIVAELVKKSDTQMSSLVTTHNKYVDVKSEDCKHDWPRAFDCGTNKDCKIKTMYRPDCVLRFIINAVQKFIDRKGNSDWNTARVNNLKYETLTIFRELPLTYYSGLISAEIDKILPSVHKKIEELRANFDLNGFKTWLDSVAPITFVPRWAFLLACDNHIIKTEYTTYCIMTSLKDAVFLFVKSARNEAAVTTKTLDPITNYIPLLEQLQINRVSELLSMQAANYFDILNGKVDDIASYLKDNFSALGNYFSSLATYDTQKSAADVAFVQGMLNTFDSQIKTSSGPLTRKLTLLFQLAFGATAADLLSKIASLVLAIVGACNPLEYILGSPDLNDIVDRANDVAQVGVNIARLITFITTILPNLADKAQILNTGFAKNSAFLKIVGDLASGLNGNDPGIVDKSNRFLQMYNDYSPAVQKSQISALGAAWETAIEEICDIAFDGSTVASALVEAGIAGKGDCLTINEDMAKYISINEQIFEFQFELIESLAQAVRAKLAFGMAEKLQIAYQNTQQIDSSFLKNTAVVSHLISTLHIWGIVNQYCNILTYSNGGTEASVCTTALNLPSHTAIAQVISYRSDISCSNKESFYMTIPTTPSVAGAKDYVDLDTLFKGDEVTLKIPNFQWLQSNAPITSGESGNSFFVEKMELYLPLEVTGQIVVNVKVDPGLTNVLQPGGTKYVIPLTGYGTKYQINTPSCYTNNMQYLPYDLCKSTNKVCMISEGKRDRPIQPSIYNTWILTALITPDTPAPAPKTPNFKLIAGVTVCSQVAASASKRSTMQKRLDAMEDGRAFGALRRHKRSTYCCTGNQYWAGDKCQNCPDASSRKLSGYFCE
ncbi:hypothetical protein SNE40_011948 [Patella caerulea]|uniref:Uncharacterized protein n=1 Tax=Patella caerulea TaxID=87958 RepID=A0AAN8JPD1_PATCE